MGLRERESGAVGRVLKGQARRRRIEIRRKTGIKRKWQSRLVLWPESPTPRVRLTRSRSPPVPPSCQADPFPPRVRLTRSPFPRSPTVCPSYGGDCNSTDFYVGYSTFYALPSYANYAMVGSDGPVGQYHPDNHNGTLNAVQQIRVIADQFHLLYPDISVLGINDMALPMGGVFDLQQNWIPPHHEHSLGTAVDVPGNGLTNSVPANPAAQAAFKAICMQQADAIKAQIDCKQGYSPCPDNANPTQSGQHFHVLFPY